MGYAERSDKTKVVGNYRVKDPTKMVKLGMVVDTYKTAFLDKLWKQAEDKALQELPGFLPSQLFHEEWRESQDKKITYAFRYYTDESNREEIERLN